MAFKIIKNITLTTKNSPEELAIINELGQQDNRLPTNAAKNLIMEVGHIKLNHPEEYRNFIKQFENEKNVLGQRS